MNILCKMGFHKFKTVSSKSERYELIQMCKCGIYRVTLIKPINNIHINLALDYDKNTVEEIK